MCVFSLVHLHRSANLHATDLLEDVGDPSVNLASSLVVDRKYNALECARERRDLFGIPATQLQEPTQANLPPAIVVDALTRGFNFLELRLQDTDKLLVQNQEHLLLLPVHDRQCVFDALHHFLSLGGWDSYS